MRETNVETMMEGLLYTSTFTQRSPIMPDVWIRYGVEGPDPQDLLLLAYWDTSGPSLAAELERRLIAGYPPGTDTFPVCVGAKIAPTQSVVAATLSFRDLMRSALPLSPWWRGYLLASGEPSSLLKDKESFAPLREALLAQMKRGDVASPREPSSVPNGKEPSERRVSNDLLWLVRVAGALALLHRVAPEGAKKFDDRVLCAWSEQINDHDLVVDAFFALFSGVEAPGDDPLLWAVHRNRRVEMAIRESTATVKADAARQLFDVTGKKICWAILDTGVDARHIAFRRRRGDGWVWSTAPFYSAPPEGAPALSSGAPAPESLTRVVKTYDFTDLRALLAAPLRELDRYIGEHLSEPLKKRFADPSERERFERALERTKGKYRKDKLLPNNGPIDWLAWGDVLCVPHQEEHYAAPAHKHGTHVAGILAADWRAEDLRNDLVRDEVGTPRRHVERKGVCPDIELYDIRVLQRDGSPDEIALIAALQFVRALNASHGHIVIHGINLSLSIPHEVSNYACGRTPVCEECERLVASGVVVVAAAGNYGRARYVTPEGKIDQGYRAVSITDPGNAESVITVGATHRANPHDFGVSYFSSRGPTGDGRAKPDLVAPGEKVTSTVMRGEEPGEESLDGTSMAAPHVSGAAALLMCRYPELIGKPAEIKRILCKTATDLGRDRYFQGAGLLDTLRAMQSF